MMLLINHRPISIWFFIMKIIAFVLLLSFAQESQAKGIFSKLKEFKSRIIKGKKSKNLPSTSVLFLGDSMSMGAFGSTLDSKLRDAGFGVTVINGEGMQGEVAILWCVTPRKKLKKVINLVEKVCPEAYLTTEPTSPTKLTGNRK